MTILMYRKPSRRAEEKFARSRATTLTFTDDLETIKSFVQESEFVEFPAEGVINKTSIFSSSEEQSIRDHFYFDEARVVFYKRDRPNGFACGGFDYYLLEMALADFMTLKQDDSDLGALLLEAFNSDQLPEFDGRVNLQHDERVSGQECK